MFFIVQSAIAGIVALCGSALGIYMDRTGNGTSAGIGVFTLSILAGCAIFAAACLGWLLSTVFGIVGFVWVDIVLIIWLAMWSK